MFKKIKKNLPMLLSIITVSSVIIYAALLLWINYPIDSYSIANAGVFGDSFGVLTSLFSALAFVGVIWTLTNQREELKLQKAEWDAQKLEINENKKEMIKQGFENSFFQMLKLHNQIVDGISESRFAGQNIENRQGRVYIRDMQISLINKFKAANISNLSPEEEIILPYNRFFAQQGYQLAHYFRFLYNIFRFLSDSEIENKEFYARLVRSQISNQELFILYYNALSPQGTKFKSYIVEFKLMDNLPPSELFYYEHCHLIPNAGFKI